MVHRIKTYFKENTSNLITHIFIAQDSLKALPFYTDRNDTSTDYYKISDFVSTDFEHHAHIISILVSTNAKYITLMKELLGSNHDLINKCEKIYHIQVKIDDLYFRDYKTFDPYSSALMITNDKKALLKLIDEYRDKLYDELEYL